MHDKRPSFSLEAQANLYLWRQLPILATLSGCINHRHDYERRSQCLGQVYGTSGSDAVLQELKHGFMCPQLHARWSDYYSENPRRPDDLTLAPWVKGARRKQSST